VIDEPTRRLDEGALRALAPRVLAGLARRGEDFDAAEDALQEALLEALRVWPEHPPRDPRAWLTTVATRRLVDAHRSEVARHRREEQTYDEPRPAATEEGDDTLFLLFCCCHPELAAPRNRLTHRWRSPAYDEARRRAQYTGSSSPRCRNFDGASRTRTGDLLGAIQATPRPEFGLFTGFWACGPVSTAPDFG
jgi:predicted RNA polymerase sigma factor